MEQDPIEKSFSEATKIRRLAKETKKGAVAIGEEDGEPTPADYELANKMLEAQKAVWHRYTDDEIASLRKELYINKSADVAYSRPGVLQMINEYSNPGLTNEKIFKNMVSQSNSNRLLDLGSGTTMLKSRQDYFLRDDIKSFMRSGLNEYIGIDLGVENYEWSEINDETETKAEIPFKYIQEEILTACHSFPDNYGNAWLTGIESGNVIRNFKKWGLALFSELKRVVPLKGFIVSDYCFIDDIFKMVSTDFQELEVCMQQNDKEKLKHWETQFSDSRFPNGSAYIVKMPEIGFDVYINKRESVLKEMVIINTKKEI